MINKWVGGFATVLLISTMSMALAQTRVYNTEVGDASGGGATSNSDWKMQGGGPQVLPSNPNNGKAVVTTGPQVLPANPNGSKNLATTRPQVLPAQPDVPVYNAPNGTAVPARPGLISRLTGRTTGDDGSGPIVGTGINTSGTLGANNGDSGTSQPTTVTTTVNGQTVETVDPNTVDLYAGMNDGVGAANAVDGVSRMTPASATPNTFTPVTQRADSNRVSTRDEIRNLGNAFFGLIGRAQQNSFGNQTAALGTAAGAARAGIAMDIANRQGGIDPERCAIIAGISNAAADQRVQQNSDLINGAQLPLSASVGACTQLSGANYVNAAVALATDPSVAVQMFTPTIMNSINNFASKLPIPAPLANMVGNAVTSAFNSTISSVMGGLKLGGLFGGGGQGINISQINCDALANTVRDMQCALSFVDSPISAATSAMNGTGNACSGMNGRIQAIADMAVGSIDIQTPAGASTGNTGAGTGGTAAGTAPPAFNAFRAGS